MGFEFSEYLVSLIAKISISVTLILRTFKFAM